ncbi:MAG: MFS transporter [Flavobacteriaceae bacterium]|nr:MFS transporter [Flavobacteriaceae bacterium]
MLQKKHILPIIVFSQFCCTSLWFAGNGVMSDLITSFKLSEEALGHLTSAVQFGFIIGTLCFSILTLVDRFPPSKVFFISALLGALCNLGMTWEGNTLTSIIGFRFLTGFFLAGIYPVGMKIAADYYESGLGKALGYLVGALVLGTAFPHLLKDMTTTFPWKSVIIAISGLATLGGLLMLLLVPNGPFRKVSTQFDFSAFYKVFQNKEFRVSAFGYFGHMWELYAFWAFVPVILSSYATHQELNLNIPLLSFLIIGVGGLACVLGGYLAQSFGVKRIATWMLLLSCICCLVSPVVLQTSQEYVVMTFLFFWGMVVIADSPLFSTLVAQNAPTQIKGTALTIVTCIGFAITIISIQLLSQLVNSIDANWLYMLLAIGPILGLISLKNK